MSNKYKMTEERWQFYLDAALLPTMPREADDKNNKK